MVVCVCVCVYVGHMMLTGADPCLVVTTSRFYPRVRGLYLQVGFEHVLLPVEFWKMMWDG